MTRRRLLAIAALLLTPLAVVSAVGFVVEDPQDAFGVLLTLSLALVAAGYGLVRRGIVRVIALVLAGMLLLGVLEVLLDRRVLDRLTIVGLFWLAVAAAAAAFAVHVPLPRASRPQRPVLFLNPRSGGGKAERFKLADEARKRGIEPIELGPGDDLATLVKTAVDEGADALAMAGGDGSQAVVAAAAAELDLPYACIPSGTRNHFALDLGVNRDDVVGALDAFVDGGERVVDLAEVNGRRLREQRLARPLRDRGAARWLSRRETAHDPRHPPGRARAAWAAPGPPVDRPSTMPSRTPRAPCSWSRTIATYSGRCRGQERGRGSTKASLGSPWWSHAPIPAGGVSCPGAPGDSGRRRISRSAQASRCPRASTARRPS